MNVVRGRWVAGCFVVLAVGGLSSQEAVAQVSASDNLFALEDWDQCEVLDESVDQSFIVNAWQEQTGGLAPTPEFRRFTHDTDVGPIAGPIDVLAAHVYRFAQYDPTIQGPLGSVCMSIDAICFDGGPSGAIGIGALLFQNGEAFIASPAYFAVAVGAGWQHLSAINIPIGAFFPADGSAGTINAIDPVKFGFVSGNGTASPPNVPIHSDNGVDNWEMTLKPVPAPSTLIVAAGGMMLRRRRRSGI